MKRSLALLILFPLIFTGCRKTTECEVIKETYMHQYGVPVAKSDWEKQGREGQTISLRSDGVTVTTSYAKGIAHGSKTYTYPNSSTIQCVENYLDGERISIVENYPSGVPMKEETFEENRLVHLTRWYEDGTPQAHESYCDSLLMGGEYRNLFNVIEGRVIDGEGSRICRSGEGDLLSKELIHNGLMRERTTYFPNGDPSAVISFENGKIHGTRLTFLKGGQPNTMEQWVRGVQEGVTLIFQNGEKIAEIPYIKGKKNGIEARYRDGSLLVEEITWQDNVKHGERTIYIDGNTKSEWYHEGEVVSRTTFERLNLPRNL